MCDRSAVWAAAFGIARPSHLALLAHRAVCAIRQALAAHAAVPGLSIPVRLSADRDCIGLSCHWRPWCGCFIHNLLPGAAGGELRLADSRSGAGGLWSAVGAAVVSTGGALYTAAEDTASGWMDFPKFAAAAGDLRSVVSGGIFADIKADGIFAMD